MKKTFWTWLLMAALAAPACAAEKNWNAQGDAAAWTDSENWLSEGAPSDEDDAKIDMRDSAVTIGQGFESKSLTIGGKHNSTVSVSNFSIGTLEPENPTDEALFLRRQGKLILKGSAGKLTVRGAFKDSEEIIPEEPSFLLYVK
jgi:hypothetical protein